MKKLLIIIMIGTMVGLVGCGEKVSDDLDNGKVVESNEANKEEATLQGFKELLESEGYTIEENEVLFQLVGAIDGYKLKISENIKLEIYDFNMKNLNDIAKENIKTIENDGEMVTSFNTIKIDAYSNKIAMVVHGEGDNKNEAIDLFNSYFN